MKEGRCLGTILLLFSPGLGFDHSIEQCLWREPDTSVALLTSIDQALRDFLAEVVREVLRQELKPLLQAASPAGSDGVTDENQYLPLKKAAEVMSVSPDAVRSWIQRGDLPAYHAGDLLRVRMKNLPDFLRASPQETPLNPEEEAERFLARIREKDATRCPGCHHLPMKHSKRRPMHCS